MLGFAVRVVSQCGSCGSRAVLFGFNSILFFFLRDVVRQWLRLAAKELPDGAENAPDQVEHALENDPEKLENLGEETTDDADLHVCFFFKEGQGG